MLTCNRCPHFFQIAAIHFQFFPFLKHEIVMNNFYSTSRIFHIFCIIALLTGCKKKQEIDPSEQIPIGKAFVSIESDGKKETYIEGNPGVESLNLFMSSTEQPNPGHGGGISVKGKEAWEFFFFYTEEEYYANTGNFTKLFRPGPFDFIKLDRNFKYLNIKENIKCQF